MNLKRVLWMTFIFGLMALLVIGCSSSPTSPTNTQGDSGSTAQQTENTTKDVAEDASETNYPEKTITFVVWSAAGSGVDVMARQAAKHAETILGQSIVVENLTGGSGATAMSNLISKDADGYTVGANTRSQVFSLATTLKDQFNPDDFHFIAQVQSDPYVIAVNTDSHIETLDELIAELKTNKKYSVGGFGASGAQAALAQEMAEQAGVELSWLPFDGGSEAVTALLGKHVDAVMTNVGQISAHVEGGTIRALAVSTPEQIDVLPGTPTFEELGYEDMEVNHWRGFYVKAGTPQEVIDVLDEAFRYVTEQPEWLEYLEDSGLFPLYVDSKNSHENVTRDIENTIKRFAD